MGPTTAMFATAAPSTAPDAAAVAALAAPGRRRTGRAYGAELDGTTLRVMELVDDVVLSFTVYRSDTVARTVRQFLSTRPKGPIVVAWHGSSTQTARFELPVMPEPALPAALAEAAEHHLPLRADAVVAARILGAADGMLQVVAASTDAAPLEEVWAAFRGSATTLVPAPLVHVHDGLYLGLRNESADLTLVEDGTVRALRHLSSGGLSTVYRELGPELPKAFERVSAVVRGAAQDDLDAVRIVSRYVNDLGVEITRTTDFWTRQGMTVPSDVFAHGPGFLLPNLAGTLMDAALFLKPVALPHASLDAISRIERPVGYVALLAGLVDLEDQPLLELSDPHLVEVARRQRLRDRNRRRILVGAGSVLATALGAVAMVQLAERSVTEAEERRDQLEQELASYRSALDLQRRAGTADRAVQAVTAGDVAWSTMIRAVLAAAPAGSRSVSLALSREAGGNVRLDVNVEVPGSQDAVAPYLQALERLGTRMPWTPNLAQPTKDPRGAETVRVAANGMVTVEGRYEAHRTPGDAGART